MTPFSILNDEQNRNLENLPFPYFFELELLSNNLFIHTESLNIEKYSMRNYL